MIINDGSVKTIQDFVTTRTVINFLPLLVSEPCFYQITLIFMIYIHYIHPFSHQKHNWRQLSSIFLAHQAKYLGNLFYFHSIFTFTFFYFLLFLLRANYFTLSWLVTPENLLQHLHSQILRRNMAQAINIVFMKIRSSFTFPKKHLKLKTRK